MQSTSEETHTETHLRLPELMKAHRGGKITRRQFLRAATLLGLPLLTATRLAASEERGSQPAARVKPASTAGEPVRGGTLRVGSQVLGITHPADFNWVEQANLLRHVAEHLTHIGSDNITSPHLLQSWTANEDLTIWTLNLRQGVTFNNGDAFDADDVIFSLGEWLSRGSTAGLMSYLDPTNIERVNSHTIKLHLDRPELAVPEHLNHYPALVLNHRTFEGDFKAAPHGTGPFTLDTFTPGDRAVLKRRNGYWATGSDGDPLPYLNRVIFIDLGDELSDWYAALQAGQVDVLDPCCTMDIDSFTSLNGQPHIEVVSIPTARTRVLRMQVDVPPWDDNRVRHALRLCQDRAKILNVAYYGQGTVGHDCHVAPVHPAYCEKPIPAYDPTQACQLLSDAGYGTGIEVTLTVGNWPDVVAYAQTLSADAATAGFDITVDVISTSEYWEHWTDRPLGITPWTHRALGVQVLNRGYTGDELGDPVAWNETRWIDEDFSTLLEQANQTLDVPERRALLCQLEQIQMDRGSIGIAYWMNTWLAYRDHVQDLPPDPQGYLWLANTWKEDQRVFLPLVTGDGS